MIKSNAYLLFLILMLSGCHATKEIKTANKFQFQKQLFITAAFNSIIQEKNQSAKKEKFILLNEYRLPASKYDFGLPMEFIAIPLKRKEVINKRSNYKIKLINDDKLSVLCEEANYLEYYKIESINYNKVGRGDISVVKTTKENTNIVRDTLEFIFEKKEDSKWLIYTAVEEQSIGLISELTKK